MVAAQLRQSDYKRHAVLILLLLALLLHSAGCLENGQQADVQLTVRLENNPPVGGPVELTYRWLMAQDAEPMSGDFQVFVHFWGEDGKIHWQDDHAPLIPTGKWRPGQIVEYTRINFASDSIPPGEITITAGLYDPQGSRKVRLLGLEESERELEYEMERFELLPADRLPIIIFDRGWYNREIGQQESGSWRWCQGEAVCWVEAPGHPCSIFLEVYAPVQILETAQRLTLEVEETLLATLELDSPQWVREKIPIPEELTRERDCFRLVVRTDKVLTPVEQGNAERRQLGVKFKHLAVY